MNMLFADTLKKLRKEKGLSQQALAEKLYVTNAAVSRWESGHRLPDAVMMSRIAGVLGADVNILLSATAQSDERPNVIMLDDNRIILNGGHGIRSAEPAINESIDDTASVFLFLSDLKSFTKNNKQEDHQ